MSKTMAAKKKAARKKTAAANKKVAKKKVAATKKVAKKKVAKKKVAKKKVAATRKGTKKKVAAKTKAAKKKKPAARQARGAKVAAAAFSGDGKRLMTAVGKHVLTWDVSDPLWPRRVGDAQTLVEVTRLAIDQSGSRFAAGVSGFSDVRIRSPDGALLHEIHARGAVTCFAFAPDGRFIVGEVERIGEQGLHARSFISLVDLAEGTELFRVPVLDLPLRDIGCSSDGLLLFLGFGGGVVVVFDLEKKRELFRFPQLGASEIGARIAADFSFSADGRRAAIQWEDVVEVWPIDGGDRLAHIPLGARTWSVAINADGSKVVCGAPAAGVWSIGGKKLADLPLGHHVVASPDGKLVMISEKLGPHGPRLASTGA